MRRYFVILAAIYGLLPGTSLCSQVNTARDHSLIRSIVADCDHCVADAEIVAAATSLLSGENKVTIGTLGWYNSSLINAEAAAEGKGVTDLNISDWMRIHADFPSHLWAQAVRVGDRLGVRSIEKGTTKVEILAGSNVFESVIDGMRLQLLDVRIVKNRGTNALRAYVHILVPQVVTAPIASSLCRHYLSDVHKQREQIDCIIGNDEIRIMDDSYPFNNPFHLVPLFSESELITKRIFFCMGPSFRRCN